MKAKFIAACGGWHFREIAEKRPVYSIAISKPLRAFATWQECGAIVSPSNRRDFEFLGYDNDRCLIYREVVK